MQKIGAITREFKYTLYKSDHLYESRHNGKFARDHFITNEIYIDIFKMALLQGLSSFRGKEVVISVHDAQGSTYNILVDFGENRDLRIVTVFKRTRTQYYPGFIKVQNRINLWKNYTLPKLSRKEKNDKFKEISDFEIDRDCRSEDAKFLYSMDNVKRI